MEFNDYSMSCLPKTVKIRESSLGSILFWVAMSFVAVQSPVQSPTSSFAVGHPAALSRATGLHCPTRCPSFGKRNTKNTARAKRDVRPTVCRTVRRRTSPPLSASPPAEACLTRPPQPAVHDLDRQARASRCLLLCVHGCTAHDHPLSYSARAATLPLLWVCPLSDGGGGGRGWRIEANSMTHAVANVPFYLHPCRVVPTGRSTVGRPAQLDDTPPSSPKPETD